MVKKQIVKVKEIPTGVKILSILSYIGAVFTLLAGLAMIFVADSILNLIPSGVLSSIGITLTGSIMVFAGIVCILFGLLDYFVGRGLWNGKNWARILVLVFSVLSVVSSIVPFDLGSLVIGGVIIWYLGFNENAKSYFK